MNGKTETETKTKTETKRESEPMLITAPFVEWVRTGERRDLFNSFEEQVYERTCDEDGQLNRPEFWTLLRENGIVKAAYLYAVQLVDGVVCEPPDFRLFVPPGQYVSDVLPDILPNKMILSAPTGCGKSRAMTQLAGETVIACSSVVSAAQLGHDGAAVWHEGRHELGNVTATTYESTPTVCEQRGGTDGALLVIDEVHNVAAAGFRHTSIEKLLAESGRFERVIGLTGTPVALPAQFDEFVTVTIETVKRPQPAKLVRWQEREMNDDGQEIKCGKRALSGAVIAAEVAQRDRRTLLFNNDKGAGLSRLTGYLTGLGVKPSEIGVFNGDCKTERIGKSIIDEATVPDDVKVLIVTSVAVESINIKGEFDAIIALSPIHPALHQQLASRLRDEAAMYYLFTNGQGNGARPYDAAAQARTLQEEVVKVAEAVNALEKVDKKTRTKTDLDKLYLRRDENGLCQPCETLIGMRAFEDEQAYYINNPDGMADYLSGYHNWQFEEAETRIVTSLTGAQTAVAKEVEMEMESDREAHYEKQIALVQETGGSGIENALFTGGIVDPVLRRVVGRVRELDEAFGQLIDGGQNDETWARACAIAEMHGDSKSKHNDVMRALTFERFKRDGDKLTAALFEAFEVGKRYTRPERFDLIRDCYERCGYGFMLTTYKRFYWSDETRPLLTTDRMEQLFNALFSHNNIRIRRDGKQERLKEIVSHRFEQLMTISEPTAAQNSTN